MGPSLIDTKELPHRGHARLWVYENGEYLFELVRPSGTGLSVFLPTYKEAVSFWRQYDEAQDPGEFAAA